jgi:oxygen-dependent protoporphyrinogen oxidase
MKETIDTEVVIIGAGLTGLTLGYYLKKSGIPFKILEKDSRTGGVIQTIKEDGFLYETGPNTGVIGNPEVAELFEDLKENCILEIADTKAKKRLIWKKIKWHSLPSGPLSAIRTPLFRLKDKFRILGEPFRKAGTNPLESVADLVRRRLGKSFLDYAIDPFIAGIYAGNPEKLVTKYALPKMYALEQDYGSLIKGGLKKSKLNKGNLRMSKATREVFSAKGGLGSLTDALSKEVTSVNIILEAQNVVSNKTEKGFLTSFQTKNKELAIQSKYLVSTVGAYSLGYILPFINPDKLEPITNLEYAKVVLTLLGYKEWFGNDINAFGGLVPSKEKKNILGILFTSSFFSNRAPSGGALLSVFLGGSRLPMAIDMSDEEIKELVLAHIKEMMATNQEPDLIKIVRYPHAIAQYEASSKERIEAIEALENEYSGLILGGNIRDGIGLADRIKQGRLIAEEIQDALMKK